MKALDIYPHLAQRSIADERRGSALVLGQYPLWNACIWSSKPGRIGILGRPALCALGLMVSQNGAHCVLNASEEDNATERKVTRATSELKRSTCHALSPRV